MAKYTIVAVQTKTYNIEVEDTDIESALDQTKEWIEDDFEAHLTWAEWKFEVMG
jgi:hypothetical protein